MEGKNVNKQLNDGHGGNEHGDDQEESFTLGIKQAKQ